MEGVLIAKGRTRKGVDLIVVELDSDEIKTIVEFDSNVTIDESIRVGDNVFLDEERNMWRKAD